MGGPYSGLEFLVGHHVMLEPALLWSWSAFFHGWDLFRPKNPFKVPRAGFQLILPVRFLPSRLKSPEKGPWRGVVAISFFKD